MSYRGGRTPLMLSGYRNDIGQASFELGEAWRVRALPDLMRTLRALPGVLGTELRLVRPAD
jgi:DNA polymerase-3 subunit alpha